MNGSEQIRDTRVKTIGGAVLLLWLVLSFVLGAGDAFVRAPGALPFPILAACSRRFSFSLSHFGRWAVPRLRHIH